MVGGERANDVELKEKRKKRKLVAEKRRQKLAGGSSNMYIYLASKHCVQYFLYSDTFLIIDSELL